MFIGQIGDCDCNFSVKIKVTEFQNKIQWAFSKFSNIHEFLQSHKMRIIDL